MQLSFCVICKNEEAKIQRCIASVKEVVDEIVVVDTGSTDRTVEIAKSEGATVYTIEWENDFAKARNKALEKVKGDWVIFLDADEHVAKESLPYIKVYIDMCEVNNQDVILIDSINYNDNGIISTLKLPKIFRRDKKMIYEGSIHERLIHVDRQLKALDCSKKIIVFHDGFDSKVMNDKNKSERNGSLLLKEIEIDPNNSNLHYYIAENYEVQSNFEKSLEHALIATQKGTFTLAGTGQRSYVKILSAGLRLNKDLEFMKQHYEKAITYDSQYPDYDWYYGAYLCAHEEMDKGLFYLEQCISKIENYKGMAPSDIAMQIDKLYTIIADHYLRIGDTHKALTRLVQLLKADKYDYNILYKLLCLLQDKESVEAIGGFLAKIYDYNSSRDKLVLASVTRKLDKNELYDYYFETLTNTEKELLQGIKN